MTIQTVLMVDDDAAIRKIAYLSLTRIGKWDVLMAESGAQALELMKQNNADVILMDVMMPEMDGPTTFKLLKEQSHITGTPVIFITAKILRQEVESYWALGAAGVIAKPFDPMTLPGEIMKIVSGADAQ